LGGDSAGRDRARPAEGRRELSRNGGSGNGGGSGGDGPRGGGGGDGGNATAGSGIAAKAASLRKNRLRVRVRCARKVDGKCKLKLTGRLAKKGPKLGKAKKVKVKSGKRKTVALKVKPRYLPQLENKRKVFVRQKVRAEGETSKKTVRLKLRRS
jgi:hypothetical protein